MLIVKKLEDVLIEKKFINRYDSTAEFGIASKSSINSVIGSVFGDKMIERTAETLGGNEIVRLYVDCLVFL